MTTEQYSIGYEEGYQAGWNAAMDVKPASKPWVGLTDEERDYIWYTVGNSDAHGDVDGWSGRAVMDAIEAKLKEKNG